MSTSEQRYGIIDQPPATCPMIDSVKQSMIECKSILEGCYDWQESSVIHGRVELADLELYEIGERMEEIRRHVEKIREWGEQWKQLAKAYAPEIDEVEV